MMLKILTTYQEAVRHGQCENLPARTSPGLFTKRREALSKGEPERLAGMAGGEGEADGVGEFADASADLEEMEAEGVELVGGGLGRGEPATEGVEEPEGSR